MIPHWTREAPTEPGRFWFRTNPDGKRQHHYDYGLLLIAWTAGYEASDSPPRLVVRTIVNMGGYSGEGDYNGWSYSGGGDVEQWLAQHPLTEIWSEPVLGPPQGSSGPNSPNLAFPPLPGKPDWKPPPPKPPVRCRCQGQKEHDRGADCKTPQEEEREKRIADARTRGVDLYECPDCSTLYEHGELVKIRECSHCDDSKWPHSEGSNCPSCNRPFSRVLTEEGCEDCHVECEKLAPEEAEPPPKKKGRRK